MGEKSYSFGDVSIHSSLGYIFFVSPWPVWLALFHAAAQLRRYAISLHFCVCFNHFDLLGVQQSSISMAVVAFWWEKLVRSSFPLRTWIPIFRLTNYVYRLFLVYSKINDENSYPRFHLKPTKQVAFFCWIYKRMKYNTHTDDGYFN